MKKYNLLPDVARGNSGINNRRWFTQSLIVAALFVCLVLPGRPAAVLSAAATTPQAPPIFNTWSSHGPWGGYVTNLAIAPSNPDIVYAWTEYDLFKSIDGGASWSHIRQNSHPARSVAIDTLKPEILYILPSVYPTQALKSTDGGASWIAIGPSDSRVSALAMDPANPATLYTLDGRFRLSKSSDGGATWSRIGNGLPERTERGDAVYVVLAVSPDNPQTLYAAAPAEIAQNQGLYRSTDGGANFSRISGGPFRNLSMLQLIVAQESSLFARTIEGWFRSTNGGATWSTFLVPDVTIASLAIDPENVALIYLGTNDGRMLKSSDGGTSWIGANVAIQSGIGRLVIDPRHPTTLYAGTLGGVFKSSDSGTSWQEASSGLGASIDCLAAPGTGTLLADAGLGGLFRSPDGGESWERVNLRDRFNLLATDAKDPNLIYAYASTNRRLYKSIDGGSSWSVTPVDLSGRYLSALAIAPGQEATLYAVAFYQNTQDVIFIRSTDSGGTWAFISKVLGGFSQLVLDPDNPNTLYALAETTCDAGGYIDFCNVVLKSTDGGATWPQTAIVLRPGTYISALAHASDSPRILYASLTDGSVLKTTDAGATWNLIKLNIASQFSYANKLAIDPTNSDTLYLGYAERVYMSTDAGASWSDLSYGLPAGLQIWQLAIDASGTSLHIGTQRGVFDYHLAPPCAAPLSPTQQSFGVGGGAGLVDITAGDCSWTARSNVDWIYITSASSGSGNATVSFIVTPNNSTAPRGGGLSIGGRVLKVTQAGLSVRIIGASAAGKKLFVEGENFDPGAVILLNGEEQATRNAPQNPRASLIGKRSGKKIKAGDRLQVRNPNGSLSDEFIYPLAHRTTAERSQGL